MAGLPGDFWVNDLHPPLIPTGFDLTNWDKMYLGPIPKAWPGVVKIEASVMLNTDVVKYTDESTKDLPLAQQTQKVFLVDKGYDPARIRATIMIWDRFSWLSLKTFMASVSPAVTSLVRPYYKLSHPAARLLDISDVIVDGFVVHPPEEQTLFVEVLMTQWFPYLVSKNIRDGGSTGVAAVPVVPDPSGNLG